MTTDSLAPVGADDRRSSGIDVTTGQTGSRRMTGLAGQYAVLVVLALVVLAPLLFTLIQAMSPPIEYIKAGKPLHPVQVSWKDRTWFTGGAFSLVARTLVVAGFLAWLQKVGSGESWRSSAWRQPRQLVAIVGGTVALAATTGPAYGSLHAADGKSQWWILGAMAVVSVTQVVGFADPSRRPLWAAVVDGVVVGVLVTGAAILFVGGAVWTQAWGQNRLGPAMLRSLTMAVSITVLQVVTSIMAAYAFVFLRFPFKRLIFALFMATLLLPLEVTLVGNVALIRQLSWINSMQALVLPFAASALGTFLIRQGFRGIPPEIEDATRLDGYGHVAFLTKFAVPLTRPVIASFTVIAALQAWNQYLWPRAVIQDDTVNTLQIQLRSIIGANIAQANVTTAAALVAAVPVALVLIAFQRQIIRGLTAGAVK